MKEKEIIEFLKSNKTKGIAFKFLPEEVQEWIENHWQVCAVLTAGGAWDSTKHYLTDENYDFNFDDDNQAFYVFCLLENYTSKTNSEDGWIEFEIDENGRFTLETDDYIDDFGWYQWQEFLSNSHMEDLKFTAFGGWQYESDDRWFTSPQLLCGDNFNNIDYGDICKPTIPKRIRFWRKKQ